MKKRRGRPRIVRGRRLPRPRRRRRAHPRHLRGPCVAVIVATLVVPHFICTDFALAPICTMRPAGDQGVARRGPQLDDLRSAFPVGQSAAAWRPSSGHSAFTPLTVWALPRQYCRQGEAKNPGPSSVNDEDDDAFDQDDWVEEQMQYLQGVEAWSGRVLPDEAMMQDELDEPSVQELCERVETSVDSGAGTWLRRFAEAGEGAWDDFCQAMTVGPGEAARTR